MISTRSLLLTPWARTLICVVLTLGASGCGFRQIASDGSLLGLVTPYRIDIVQGNAITREQLAVVKPGMTRLQVRDVLGTAMLSDPFNADRWDYVFTIRRPGTPEQRRHVVAHFDGDVLQRLDAPADLPSENEFVASIDPARRAPAARRALELTEAERAALPAPAARPPGATAEAAAGPTRTYPPLER